MMSKKKWFIVLCLFIIYLLLGAGIFYTIESEEENKIISKERGTKSDIHELLKEILNKTVSEDKKNHLFSSLSDYCGKTVQLDMLNVKEKRYWDFYHSLFFVITVVSTIGYGNLAPTTMFGRIFMIFYGLIGIPMNGIVMVTLGTYFGRSFTKLYRRWKTSKVKYAKHDITRLGLIGQVILYLVPGFTFFIFLPSAVMKIFEGWDYDVAVYYCFVTLTTIGFGDYVAGVDHKEFSEPYLLIYKIFLLIWVIGGLGYVVMILGFITQAMQSKKMHEIEQIITQNIKKTPFRIRQELRTLLQEFLFLKVKRVYKGEFDYTPTRLERSQSCPDLTIYRNFNSPSMARKRAFSECPRTFILHRIQSDTDLDRIDKDLTFQPTDEFMQQKDLLLKVVDALSNLEDRNELSDGGYEGFSDAEILASESYGSKWSLRSQTLAPPKPQRRRAVSDIRVPTIDKVEAHNDITWYGQDAATNYQKLFKRPRTFSEPNSETEKSSQNLLTKLKNKFISSKDDKSVDVEQNRRDSMFTPAEDRYLRQTNRGRASVLSTEQQEAVLEQTSIADFIRALSAITVPETMLQPTPKRKLGTAGLSPPKQSPPRARRLAIRPNLQARRTSLMPEVHIIQNERRRFSLRPVEENFLAPPPYSLRPPEDANKPPPSRRFSRTLNVPSISISPVQRQVNKRDKEES
ncbi:open rectifier potassium channel protein 1 [Asbolus verrucosus]|uniref:Open rectifier potassium channel protein 1 n=1 Tax=Asbolus verrucosus TaxID=1661398 RepID=A0A482VNE8_ASBVE|nr:open rectifier potassium channel protein 1 [Asbolus verrucosus]